MPEKTIAMEQKALVCSEAESLRGRSRRVKSRGEQKQYREEMVLGHRGEKEQEPDCLQPSGDLWQNSAGCKITWKNIRDISHSIRGVQGRNFCS